MTSPGRTSNRLVRWWATGSAVLLILAIVVMLHPAPLPGEVGYVDGLQRLGTPVPELASFVRATTGTEGNLIVLVGPAAWLIGRTGRRGALAVAILVTTMVVVQPVAKELVDRPRPDTSQVEVRASHTSTSFPSGHSMSTTAVWGTAVGLAALDRRRRLVIAAAVPIVVTGVSSGVQGVHWPSDALAGTLAGALAASVAVRVLHDVSPADVVAAER